MLFIQNETWYKYTPYSFSIENGYQFPDFIPPKGKKRPLTIYTKNKQ